MAGEQKESMLEGFDTVEQQGQSTISEPPKLRKRGEGATTLTLTISREDKVRVKTWAAQHCTTVSDLMHLWIQEHCKTE